MSFRTAVYETSGFFTVLLSCEFKLAFFKCRKLSSTIFHEIFALRFRNLVCVSWLFELRVRASCQEVAVGKRKLIFNSK